MDNETEERNYGAEPWRAPTLKEDDALLFSECGRVVKAHTYGHDDCGIDYRSHYFRIVRARYGGCFLLVKHGGGEERFQLDYSKARIGQFFEPLDSTQRYLLMHLFYNVHSQAKQATREKTAHEYKTAFANGKLKKRKQRGSSTIKVWIERELL